MLRGGGGEGIGRVKVGGGGGRRRMKAVGVCIADLFPPTHSSWRI